MTCLNSLRIEFNSFCYLKKHVWNHQATEHAVLQGGKNGPLLFHFQFNSDILQNRAPELNLKRKIK